ncbi:MAG: M3 family oligoendopeptidase [Planctomycetota bacterium]|jgi:oligoendopeptidase F
MQLTRTPDVSVPANRFVPEGFDPTDTEALEALVQKLLDRPIGSSDELQEWIYDTGEIAAQVQGGWARRATAMHRDTRNEESKRRHLDYAQRVMPLVQRLEDRVTRRYLECEYRSGLGEEFEVFDRHRARAAEIFREENTELFAEEQKLSAAWQEVMGAVTIELDGEEFTAQQCATKLQERDRDLRERAYLAMARRRAQDHEKIDVLFDELIELRQRMAENAGFANYRDFRFAALGRFDYTPDDCEGFHEAAEKIVLPVLRERNEVRRRILGLERLRPCDMDVSLFNRDPERVFEDQESYVALLRRFFLAVDPVFADDFEILVRNGLLDLMSRPGKAPGGYNCPVGDIRLPFIFYNAVGMAGDVRVLLHEGGHAFHTIACRSIPVTDYRHSPAEFAEVASMSMELFGLERADEILGGQRARELAFRNLEGHLQVFASVAQVDAFQHWVYSNPGHGREERRGKWTELRERFLPDVDWSGLEEFRGYGWQAIPHLFTHPLYYIEYGIACLGALQMWRSEREDHDGAVAAYRRALALGGSRPLPELFAAAGIRFGMDEAIFEEVVPDLVARIRELSP